MREKTDLFQIDGEPMLASDAGVGFSYEDLDDDSSGRDEGGNMHRFVVRYKVGAWQFGYDNLTEEEKNYMESIFPDSPTFMFTHPDRHDSSLSVTTECYRSKCRIDWYNAKTGLGKNYKFNIIEC